MYTIVEEPRELILRLINIERVNAYPKMEVLTKLNDDDIVAQICSDSFATVMLIVEVDEIHGGFDNDFMKTIEYSTLSIGDMLNRIKDVRKQI